MSDIVDLGVRFAADFPFFARHCLKVKTKTNAIIPFVLNVAQQYIHARIEEQRARTGRVRAIILKARQEGASTYIEGRYYWRVVVGSGIEAVIIAHEQLASDNLYAMARRYHEHMPDQLKRPLERSNAKELRIGDCLYRVLTAGTQSVGRSLTLTLLHASEFAVWPMAAEHMSGLVQAVPDAPGTEIIIESTAKGIGTTFHKMWQAAVAGTSEYTPIFVPWFWMPEYAKEPPPDFQMSADELEALNLHGLTPAQVYWRRNKINSELDGDEARFMEEYPATPDEAFRAAKRDVFIQPNSVLKARRYLVPDESEAPLIVAMDPARFGPDSSAFAWRRGRLASKFVRKSKWDTMALAGLAVNIIKADSPAAFFIDVIGLGAGVYDRLIELGYSGKVIAVNGAENATEDERYHNKRAECWGRMKEWLNSGAVQIPDSDALAQDLLRPGFKYDSRGRVLLESKDDIRAKGDPSPDLGDALAMTFAEFVATPAPGSMYGGAVTVGDRTAGY